MSSLNFDSKKNHQLNAVHRLTALWALNESGLGGIMHALHIPFTGFFVGGIAVILIGLIAHYSNHSFRQIIQATISVIIVKAIVSPQSPIPAYVAVAFQGFMGALLYTLFSNFTFTSVLFGFLALLESAIQKFLITTLLFGKSVWEALDIFFKSLLKDFALNENFSFSFWLIIIYCAVYAIWGIILGWWISKLPHQIEGRSDEIKIQIQSNARINLANESSRSKSGGKRSGIYVLIVLAFIVCIFSMNAVNESQKALYAVLRTIAVLLAWFVFVQPLIKSVIRRYASNKQKDNKYRTSQLIASLPALRTYAQQSYELASLTHKGLLRYREFIFILVVITLHSDEFEL